MLSPLVATAALMGLAGGPHCLAMCGAACAGVGAAGGGRALAAFHLGRLAGYSAAGALVAASLSGVGAVALENAALRPLWTLFNLAALALGLALVARGRQPAWLDRLARAVWERARRLPVGRGGGFLVGVLWAAMPCGLLYAALAVAALSGSAADGAAVMAAFALASAGALVVGPALWLRLRAHSGGWGVRVAGAGLAAASGWGVWLSLAHQNPLLCAVG